MSDLIRMRELEAELRALKLSLASQVFTVVIDGNPGELGINHAKKAAKVKGVARLVDTGRSKKAKGKAKALVFRAALANPEAASTIQDAPRLIVEIDSYWPEQRHLEGAVDLANGDVDGPLKLTIDSLEKAKLIDDDARVVEVRGRKFIDRANPRIEMRVMPAPPQEEDADGQRRLV